MATDYHNSLLSTETVPQYCLVAAVYLGIKTQPIVGILGALACTTVCFATLARGESIEKTDQPDLNVQYLNLNLQNENSELVSNIVTEINFQP